MNTISLLLIAMSLSMDSLAVSISNGLTVSNLNTKKILTISFSLTFFQVLMPLMGWFIGSEIDIFIKEIDHWVAFILLSIVGSKMIYDGFKNTDTQRISEIKIAKIFGQSLATSIDAFVIGISFALLNLPISLPLIIIGLVTFGFSLVGLILGKHIGNRLGNYASLIGGIILIGIGLKILIEHLYFQ